MRRSAYHHYNLRTDLIEKGLILLDNEGYDNFSMRKVATACGVSHAAPYRHFKNKDNLIHEIVIHVYHKFDYILNEAVHRYPNNAKSQLREMAYLYIKFFVENPEYLRFIFFSDLSKKMKMSNEEALMFSNMEQPYRTFIRSVKCYQEENTNDTGQPMDTEALILASWGLAHGIALLITSKDFQCSGDCLELVRKIVWSDLFIR